MRAGVWSLLMGLVVIGAPSCSHRSNVSADAAKTAAAARVPPVETAPEAATAATAATADTMLTFRGLVAFDLKQGTAVFLSPPNEPHPPSMVFDLAMLEDGSGLPASAVAARTDGTGLGIWTFKKVELNVSNLVETDLDAGDAVKSAKVNGDAPANDPRIGWVPKMSDIFGTDQVMDDAVVRTAAATGTFPAGRVSAVFDRPTNRTALYDIGYRKCTAVADALRLTVKIKDPKKPLLRLTPLSGGAQDFVIVPGTPIEFVAFPLKKGKDFEHTHHFFVLGKGDKSDRPVRACPSQVVEPGIKPIRCAPFDFP